jgi:hypothetical protein
MSQREDDIEKLQRALAGKLNEETREAFNDMIDRMSSAPFPQRELTEKQRAWVCNVLDEPEYENAWSAGTVPRGREVPTPAVLQNLPKKPPPRRGEE